HTLQRLICRVFGAGNQKTCATSDNPEKSIWAPGRLKLKSPHCQTLIATGPLGPAGGDRNRSRCRSAFFTQKSRLLYDYLHLSPSPTANGSPISCPICSNIPSFISLSLSESVELTGCRSFFFTCTLPRIPFNASRNYRKIRLLKCLPVVQGPREAELMYRVWVVLERYAALVLRCIGCA
ncbi:hypothetical protein L9F63_013936, partial [Diploptera punctata]